MTKPQEHAEIIKAWADGAAIEYFSALVEDWMPVSDYPLWAEFAEYRIKPTSPANKESKAVMTKPEHTRPFNLEHAKAGAPYCCRDGAEAMVIKWDCRDGKWPLVGVMGANDNPVAWGADGGSDYCQEASFDIVMTQLGFIDGKPVFVGDEFHDELGLQYKCKPHVRDFTGCTWPAPARQYPVTGMNAADVTEVYRNGPVFQGTCLLAVANAGLRHAIDADTVRITEEVKAREWDIAKAVMDAVKARLLNKHYFDLVANGGADIDLADIIASVKG